MMSITECVYLSSIHFLWWSACSNILPIFLKEFLYFYLFIYLFLAVLGLHFCARAFSSCSERGPLFNAVRRPLTVAASLVAEHKFQTRRLSNCGSRAYLLRGMWDLPRPGLEPVSPALAGRFSTTAPPGKPDHFSWYWDIAMFCLGGYCYGRRREKETCWKMQRG